ncbi:50S ribosomal protein L25 [Intestinibacter bartlettii]|uniref:Large ribosomal subunit protein bL25 n=1 Tax=Intestinibacter bartlettii TaxID=261299 RepID=A0ABS6DTF8_9FIRM|nr:50S ribosomal protein L25 [Intestinibacter bartlettii]MBU5335109.1 50S ribosomal protein L25 [Intestinibacter bartlettii]
MESTVFNITERTEKGKKVRMKGDVPGIIYGQSLDKPIPCQITKRELIDLLGSNSSVLALKLNGKTESCVLKEVQRDAFGNIVHLDFQHVKKGDSVKLRVPIRFAGTEALDAKKLLLDDIISEIQLQGDPSEMPEHIEVDVSALEHGAEVLAKDLVIPATLKVDLDPETVVARIGSLKTSGLEVAADEDSEEVAE